MTLIRTIGKEIRSYFTTKLNPVIQEVGVALGETISPVNKFIGTIVDPYSLPCYNTLMIGSASGNPDKRNADVQLHFELVLAVSSGSEEAVERDCEGTLDAIVKMVQDDHRLGGAVLNSNITEFIFYPLIQGNSSVGVVYIKLAVSIDAR